VFDGSGEPQPYLAESWEADESLQDWTVTLRQGITFHDGETFDADAVKANLDAAVESPLVGLALAPMIESIEVVDTYTVVIHTTSPWASVPGSLFALQPGMMISPNSFDDMDTAAQHPVGTGAFEFEEWVRDDHFSVVRNDDYWRTADNGDQLPYLDRIEFRVLVDSAARAAALASGEIDLMYTVRAPDIADYLEMPADEITVIQDNEREATFVQFNEGKAPFDNEHARRAAVMAVDPDVVTAILGDGITQTIEQPFAPDELEYTDDPGYVGYDPEGAQRELDLYREATGEDTLRFTLAGLPSVDDAELLQLLVQQWEEVGIEVELENKEQTQYIVDLATANFEASYFRNFGPNEPDFQYTFLHSDNAAPQDGSIRINFTGTQVPELDALLEEQRTLASREDRARIWQQIVPVINAELPYLWLFNTPYALVASPDIRGLNTVREIGFGNFEPKWWWGEVWRQP